VSVLGYLSDTSLLFTVLKTSLVQSVLNLRSSRQTNNIGRAARSLSAHRLLALSLEIRCACLSQNFRFKSTVLRFILMFAHSILHFLLLLGDHIILILVVYVLISYLVALL